MLPVRFLKKAVLFLNVFQNGFSSGNQTALFSPFAKPVSPVPVIDWSIAYERNHCVFQPALFANSRFGEKVW
ncbi:hypothetical protein [Neisseria dentiae]|uniref:hypothetical protein n=1 Tax=Neisseria dentiae TaxID=194197 RepID=UPI0035A047DF